MQNLFRSLTKKISAPKRLPYPLRSSSGRIFLHPLRSGEVAFVESWFRDRETCELAFGVKAPPEVLESMRDEYLAELQRDKLGVLAVRLDSPALESPPVGFVRYKLFRRGRHRSARVGIILGPPTLRGRKIGREAFETLLAYLFELRAVQIVELDTATFNVAAQHCFQSCGFQPVREVEFTGVAPDWTERRLMMRLTAAEWRAKEPSG